MSLANYEYYSYHEWHFFENCFPFITIFKSIFSKKMLISCKEILISCSFLAHFLSHALFIQNFDSPIIDTGTGRLDLSKLYVSHISYEWLRLYDYLIYGAFHRGSLRSLWISTLPYSVVPLIAYSSQRDWWLICLREIKL